MSFRFARRVVQALRRLFTPNRRARLSPRWVIVDRLFHLRRQLEELESRVVPATVTWDGGASTFNWFDANNWDTNTLPVSGDDVVIPDLTGTPTITSNGAVNIRSVVSAEKMAITAGS